MNLFEKASRMKLRIETDKGNIAIEDLWDLPLIHTKKSLCLDDIARILNKKLKDSEGESFVLKTTKTDETLSVAFEIVKHIIAVKLEEAETAKREKAIKEKKQQIMAIIADKELDHLKGASMEDLQRMLNEL